MHASLTRQPRVGAPKFRAPLPDLADLLAWLNDDSDNTPEDYPGEGWDDPSRWESTEDQRWTTGAPRPPADDDQGDEPSPDDWDQRSPTEGRS